MAYIYIFEDGALLQTDVEPSPDDFDGVANGIIQIIRVDLVLGLSEYNGEKWTTIKTI